MRLIKKVARNDLFGICDDKTGWWFEYGYSEYEAFEECYREVKSGRGWADEDFYNSQEKLILAPDNLFEWEKDN